MTENISRKDLTKVCTLDRDEMTPSEKHVAFLAAIYENRDHEPLTTTDIRRATGLSNKDVQYEREKFVELGYIEASRPDEFDESGRPASYEYWLENDGKRSLTNYEYGDPADIRQETPYDLAQNALDGVKQAENRLRLELASNKRVSDLEDEVEELKDELDALDEYVIGYAEGTNETFKAVMRALADNDINLKEYHDGNVPSPDGAV